MDALRLELVIGFTLLLLVAIPAIVVRLLDRRARQALSPPVSVKTDSTTTRICPFCKDAIAADAVHIECATCKTKHHATCFEENHGCAVFGCKEKRGVGRAERTQ